MDSHVAPDRLVSMIRYAEARWPGQVKHFCETYPEVRGQRLFNAGFDSEMSTDLVRYECTLGLNGLRSQLAMQTSLGSPFRDVASDNILVTCGGTHAIFVSIVASRLSNKKILIPSPSYSGYVDIARALAVAVESYELTSFRCLDYDQLYSRLSTGDLLVLNSPHNPTGSVMSQAQVKQVVEAQKEVGFSVIFDGVYDQFDFTGRESQNVNKSAIPDNFIYINSMSKNFGLPGLRVGWIAASDNMIERLASSIEFSVSALSGVNQRFALEALQQDDGDLVRQVKKRRDHMMQRLGELPDVSFKNPDGGTIMLLDLDKHNAKDFCHRLLSEHKILLAPADIYFGNQALNTVRLSYGYGIEGIDQVINAIEQEL